MFKWDCMFAYTEYVILLCSGDRAYSCFTYHHPFFGPSPSFFVEKYKKWTKLSVVDGYCLCWVQVSRCFTDLVSKTLFSFVFLKGGWMISLGNRRQTWVPRINCYMLRSFWKCLLWQNTLQFWPHTIKLSPVWSFEKILWGQHYSSEEALQNILCKWL